jgi:serine/threonine-protein kinase
VTSDVTQAPAHGLAPTVRRPAAPPRPRDEGELEPGSRVGDYVIGHCIGVGGMGSVYSAIHPVIGKKAAIKVIASHLCRNEDAVGRFLQEARAVNAIGHPHIVDVFSVGALPDGRSYLVMELLEGETLGERMAREPLGVGEALDLFDQVLAAVEAAHDKQIIHRDLKPDNVFLIGRPGGGLGVKLLDFGIAKLQGPTPGVRATTTGMLLGTPMYMAPEQATGREITAAVDVYALGGVCFEMLTGRPPFWADNAAEVIAMHLHALPPTASLYRAEIPLAVDQLLVDMLSKDPAQRPPVARVRQALRHPDTWGTGPLSSPSMAAYAPGPRSRRARLLLGLGLGVAAVAGISIAAVIDSRGGDLSIPDPPAPAIEATPAPVAAAPVRPDARAPASAGGGTLVVAIADPDARVWIDDREIEVRGGLARADFAEDGEHRLVARAPGRREQETLVKVAEGATVHVPITLIRRRSPARETRPSESARPRPGPRDRDAPIPDPFLEATP